MKNPLLPKIKSQKQEPLGLDDDLGQKPVKFYLEEIFRLLCNALDSSKQASTPVIFSADSFSELFNPLFFSDEFATQIGQCTEKKGNANAKICHMRLYQTSGGTHWHAIFGELDANAVLRRITLTDSKVKPSEQKDVTMQECAAKKKNQGITAQRDIEREGFLKEKAAENILEFMPSIEQPPGTHACWIYALANLAALAVTGRPYEQISQENLGMELYKRIKEVQSKSKLLTLATDNGAVKEITNKAKPETSASTEQGNAGTNSRPGFFSLREPRNPLLSPSKPDSSKPGYNIDPEGYFWLLGAGAAFTSALISIAFFPPLSVTLAIVALIMAITGSVIAINEHLIKNSHAKEIKNAVTSISPPL